jgi:hypothetical protein
MVQVADPITLRKDMLESLREVIIFMQGYEKFRALQEEKIVLFASLRGTLKELNYLVDAKLKKYMPKGKLRGITMDREVRKPLVQSVETKEDVDIQDLEIVPVKVEKSEPKAAERPARIVDDLDQLESQLREIENQLRGMK